MQIIGALVLFALIFGGTAMYTRSRVGHIAANGTPGAKKAAKGAQKQALKVGEKAAAVWAEAHSTDWLEVRRLKRQRAQGRRDTTAKAARATASGTGSAIRATAGAAGRAARWTGRRAKSASRGGVRRLVMAGGTWKPEDTTPAQANGHVPAATLAPPAAAQPAQPQTASTTPNGRTPSPMTTPGNSRDAASGELWNPPADSRGPAGAGGGAGADMFTAISGVRARMMAGGLRAKQSGLATLSDGIDFMATTVEAIAREMSEPGREYPAHIWERVTACAAHLKAAASSAGEGSSGITALAGMNVGELADSSIKAPHNNELNAA